MQYIGVQRFPIFAEFVSSNCTGNRKKNKSFTVLANYFQQQMPHLCLTVQYFGELYEKIKFDFVVILISSENQ